MVADRMVIQVFLTFLLTYLPLAVGRGSRLNLRASTLKNEGLQWPSVPSGQPRPPVVHFLFLATSKVNNLGIWNSFFSSAPKDQYRAYVHCKLPECIASVSGSALVPISTVPSYYCADLVTPMNQLLHEALGKDGQNPSDKFVFVSDSTLPAKPFAHIYAAFTERSGSDFCVCSMKEWATRRNTGTAMEVAIKHHQWSVLERSHAEKIVEIWKSGSPLVHNFLMRFEMNLPPRSRSVKAFGGSSDAGCLDEFFHMAALYGTLPYTDSHNNSMVNLPTFTNGPLRVSPGADLQGSCDTFVAWPEYSPEYRQRTKTNSSNAFTKLYAEFDALSTPYSGNAEKPGYWDTISSHGLRAIRASDFFFARKFADRPKIVDGGDFASVYVKLVLV